MGVEGGIQTEQGRAIWTDDLGGVAHVEIDMGMVERRHFALAHELVRADLDHRDAGRVMEMRNDLVGHAVRRFRPLLGTLGAPPEMLAPGFDAPPPAARPAPANAADHSHPCRRWLAWRI